MSTNNRRQVYEQIRYLVINEATNPLNGDKTAQRANKKLAEECLRTLCRTFDPAMPPEKFWIEGWHHFRRAGIRASTGSNGIEAHEHCGVFSDFRCLCSVAWDFPAKGLNGDWGAAAKKYIDRDPPYNQREWCEIGTN